MVETLFKQLRHLEIHVIFSVIASFLYAGHSPFPAEERPQPDEGGQVCLEESWHSPLP